MASNWKLDRTPPKAFQPVVLTITLSTKEELDEFIAEFGETSNGYMPGMYKELENIQKEYES